MWKKSQTAGIGTKGIGDGLITGLYGLGRFQGAALMVIVCAACLLLCIGIGSFFRCNRTPAGRKRLWMSIGVAALVSDVLMIIILFPKGEYHNYGIGAAYGALLYPAALCVTTAVVTAWNKDDSE